MKYEVGDDVQVVKADGSVHPHVWEVVGTSKENSYVVQLKDKGTDYSPHWTDVSILTKKK